MIQLFIGILIGFIIGSYISDRANKAEIEDLNRRISELIDFNRECI